MYLIWAAITQLELKSALFAIPFCVCWIIVAATLINGFLGIHRYQLDSEGYEHEWTVFRTLKREQIPLEDLKKFQVKLVHEDTEDRQKTFAIEVVSNGRSLTFGSHLPSSEREWLAVGLTDLTRKLQGSPRSKIKGVRQSTRAPLATLPADSTWMVVEDFIDLVFEQRGTFSKEKILILFLSNVFWNGILAIFVLGSRFDLFPEGFPMEERQLRSLPIFLIPFELIGLILFVSLLGELLEPFRTTRWVFRQDDIQSATTRLGLPLGLRRRYRHAGIHTAAVGEEPVSPRKPPSHPTGETYRLILTGVDDEEICTIKKLTLGEARWMKAQLKAHGDLKGVRPTGSRTGEAIP